MLDYAREVAGEKRASKAGKKKVVALLEAHAQVRGADDA